jgi:hypothetical protein
MNAAPGRERALMAKRYKVQLTIIGKGANRVQADLLVATFQPECLELLECAQKRYAWQFECLTDPVEKTKRVAAVWPALKFLVFYGKNRPFAIGIAVITAEMVKQHEIPC